jgi:hypothetical protein
MATPTPGIVQRSDSTTREEWDVVAGVYRMWDCGQLVIERPFTPDEVAQFAAAAADATRQVNRAALLAALLTALTANSAYLAKVTGGTAVAADHLGQVPALTRQVQALIRITGGAALLDTSGDATSPSRTT